MAKDVTRIRSVVNESIGEIAWGPFADGTFEILHMGRVSDANKAYAAFHGLKQTCVDAMALDADDFGGKVPESAKREELRARITHLESGTAAWSQRGRMTGAGERSLLRRVMEELGLVVGVEWMKARSGTEVSALLMRSEFKVVADRLLGEATAGVNTEELLAGLR